MAFSRQILKEYSVYIILGITLSFLLVNFNKALSETFMVLLVTSFILFVGLTLYYKPKPRLLYPFEADDSYIGDLIVGVVAFATYIIVSIAISFFFKGAVGGTTQSVLGTLASATPILSDSFTASFIFFVILVTTIETIFFFGRIYEWLGRLWKVDVLSINQKSVGVILFVAGLFTAFHLTVRSYAGGISFDTTGLAMTFTFGIISMLYITIRKTKELSPIIFFHMLVNGTAIIYNTPAGKAFLNSIIS